MSRLDHALPESADPVHFTLFYKAERERALLLPDLNGRDEAIELPGRHARLLKFLVDARARDAGQPARVAGWRARERLAASLSIAEAATISHYGAALVKTVRRALEDFLGAPPRWDLIERERDLGFRLSAAVEIRVIDPDRLQEEGAGS